jgi:FdhD protein
VSIATLPVVPRPCGQNALVDSPAPVAGLLLTGGRSRRFGADKALLPVDGVAAAVRLGRVLAAALDGPVLEVGPGHSELPTAAEDRPGEGPLAALAAGARALRARGHTGPAVVLACDLPRAHEALVRWLAGRPGTAVPVVDGRPQLLCARYDRDALALAPALVDKGARALRALLDAVPVHLLTEDEWAHVAAADDFADVDTPGDAERLLPRMPTTPVRVMAVRHGRTLELPDTVVTEAALQVEVAGPGGDFQRVNVTMRTPGHDFELAAGWLLAEGVIDGADDVSAIRYAGTGVVRVRLTRPPLLDDVVRRVVTTASCGVCGTGDLDHLAARCEPISAGAGTGTTPPVPLATLLALPDALRREQDLFDRTGGLHAAGLFGRDGALLAVREDVGRHNAVDKLVGHALLARRLPLADHVLVLSGRVGYELVQKAAVAGIPVLCAVGAPSSLAVETAERTGITVLAFVRGDRANVYTHPQRIAF